MEKPDEDVVHQCPLAAQEMGAAGNVEDEAERRIESDEGRIAIAPVGDRGKKPPIGLRIAGQGLAGRKAGARLRQAEAGQKTGLFGMLADRRDAIGIGRVAVKGEEGRRPAPCSIGTTRRGRITPWTCPPCRPPRPTSSVNTTSPV